MIFRNYRKNSLGDSSSRIFFQDFLFSTTTAMFVCLICLVIVLPSSTFGDHEIFLSLPSSPSSSHTIPSTLFRDSPLLRSRKRILPMSSSSSNHQDQSSSTSSSFMPLEPIAQNQDFITDRVKMNLECRPKSMLLQMNFTEPFRGVVSVGKSSYPSFEQSQECALRGDGRRRYSLQIFHNRCLTRFDKKRGQFTNTLFVRYHPTLETGGDYSKTLVCKFGLVDFSVN